MVNRKWKYAGLWIRFRFSRDGPSLAFKWSSLFLHKEPEIAPWWRPQPLWKVWINGCIAFNTKLRASLESSDVFYYYRCLFIYLFLVRNAEPRNHCCSATDTKWRLVCKSRWEWMRVTSLLMWPSHKVIVPVRGANPLFLICHRSAESASSKPDDSLQHNKARGYILY